MNDLSKINAFNKIPQSLIKFKNNYESYQSNSIINSQKTKNNKHRKSNSLDVKRLYEIHETNQSSTSREEEPEEASTHRYNEMTLSNYNTNEKSKEVGKKTNLSLKMTNNGYQSERRDHSITALDSSIYSKDKNTKKCNQNRSLSNRKQQNINLIKTKQPKNTAPIPRHTKTSNIKLNNISFQNQNKSPVTFKRTSIQKNQMSNGSKPLPKTSDRLDMMYMKGLEKYEKFKKLNEEQTIQKNIEEIAECTFKPKLNKVDNNHYKLNLKGNIPIHERHKLWNEKKIEKIEKEKLTAKVKEQKECTFSPDLNRKQLEIFDGDVQADRDVKKYIERLDKAKKIKEEIYNKYNPDFNERYERLVKSKYYKTKETKYICVRDDDYMSQFTTFNPQEDTKLTYDSALKNLHSRLHSLELWSNE